MPVMRVMRVMPVMPVMRAGPCREARSGATQNFQFGPIAGDNRAMHHSPDGQARDGQIPDGQSPNRQMHWAALPRLN
jgi:hypothetical protein